MIQNIRNASREESLHQVQSAKQNSNAKECCKTLCRVAAVVTIVTLAILSIIATAMMIPSVIGAVFISLAILCMASEGLRQTTKAAANDVIINLGRQPTTAAPLRDRSVAQI